MAMIKLVILHFLSFLSSIYSFLTFINLFQNKFFNPLHTTFTFSVSENNYKTLQQELFLDKHPFIRSFYDLIFSFSKDSFYLNDKVYSLILAFLPYSLVNLLIIIAFFIVFSYVSYKLTYYLVNKKRYWFVSSKIYLFLYGFPLLLFLPELNAILFSKGIGDFYIFTINAIIVGFFGGVWSFNLFLGIFKELYEKDVFEIMDALHIQHSTQHKILNTYLLYRWLGLFELFVGFLLVYGLIFLEHITNREGLGFLLLESFQNKDIFLFKALIITFALTAFILHTIFLFVKLRLSPKLLFLVDNYLI